MHKKSSKKWAAKVALLLLIIAIGYFWYQQNRYNYYITTPVDPSDSTNVSFSIKKGDTVNKIAKNLYEKKLILDAQTFSSYIQKESLDRKVATGRFFLNPSKTIPEIAAIITDFTKSQAILTVQEGSTILDIDKKLVDLSLIQAGDFNLAAKNYLNDKIYQKYPFLDKTKIEQEPYQLEGYLFPDTYFLDPNNFKNEDLIQMMLDNFKKKALPELNKALTSGNRNLHDTLTMASIIEKEARTTKDLPIISGILWKRLDKGWQIGADATLLYLKAENSINYNDLKQDSPYNTRKKVGLPPGPICNPGLKSIEAAVNPKESPYFYYLTKPGSGEVVYAVSNDEQNQNKAKYLY